MKRLLLVLLSISPALMNSLFAQTLAGADIYYEMTGPKKFLVTAHVYRQCETAPLTSLTVYAFGGSLQIPVSMTRTNISKIDDTCGMPCGSPNGISNAGFERHTYTGTIDFNSSTYKAFVTNNICFVNVGIRQSGRNGSATTHNAGLFYVDAGINICDSFYTANHSPVFSMEPKFYGYCNHSLYYSPGPLDTMEYDSLAFSLEPLQSNYNTNITYKNSFTYQIPFTPYCPPTQGAINCRPLPNAKPARGFYFDGTACQMIFTPTSCNEKGYVKMRIREYRRNPKTGQMVLLGFSTREMLLSIKPSPNNNPVVMTSPVSPYNLCSAPQLFTIKTSDDVFAPQQTIADTTTLFWDHGMTNATDNIVDTSREKTIDILLKRDTSFKSFRTRYFTVGAFDKRCNISLVTKTTAVPEYPDAKFSITKSLSSCRVYRYSAKSADTSDSWIESRVNIYDPSSKIVFSSYKNSDSFTFNSNGKHIIEYMIARHSAICFTKVRDTVVIGNAFPKGNLNKVLTDTTVCAPYALRLTFNPSRIPGLNKIEWLRNDTVFNSKDSVIQDAVSVNTKYNLRLTDNNGCKSENMVNYQIKQHNALIDLPLTVCKYSIATNTALIGNLALPIQYKWQINGKDTSVTDRDLHFMITDTTKVNLEIKDNNNCVFRDSLMSYIIPSFTFRLAQDRPDICTDSSLTMHVSNITAWPPYKVQWAISPGDTVDMDSTVTRSFHGRQAVKLIVTDAFTCPLYDSIVVVPVKVSKVSLPVFTPVCENFAIVVKPALTPFTSPRTLQWFIDGQPVAGSDSTYSILPRHSFSVALKATNKLGCYSIDSSAVKVNPIPVPVITGDTNYHRSNFVKLSTSQPHRTYVWSNNVFIRDNNFWASDLGPPGKYTIMLHVTDSNDCSGSDTITIHTDQFTGITGLAESTFAIYPNPSSGELNIEVDYSAPASIYTVDGRQVVQVQLSEGVNTIDISKLARGLYTVRFGNKSVLLTKE